MRSSRWTWLACALALAAVGCDKSAEPQAKAATKREGRQDEGIPRRIEVSAAVADHAGIRAEIVSTERLDATVELVGELVPDPERVAEAVAPISGRVAELRVREGDIVQKGQVLAVLESADLAGAHTELLAAKARLGALRSNAARLRSLVQSRAASEQEAVLAESDVRSLDARIRSTETQLRVLGRARGAGVTGIPSVARVEILSPIDGTVIERKSAMGRGLAVGDAVARLADLDRVWFAARLFEGDVPRVSIGQPAQVRLFAQQGAMPGDHAETAPFAGKVVSIGREVDAISRTLSARIALDKLGGLARFGLAGTARIRSSLGTAGGGHPIVPTKAITEMQGRRTVYIEVGERAYEARPVVVGRSSGGRVEVLEGIEAGDKVVVSGAFTIKSVMLKSTFGEEE